MDKKRSVGVTIFAWLFIIIGIMGLLRFGLSGLLGRCAKISPDLEKTLPTGICPIVSKDFNFYLNYYWRSLLSPVIWLIGGIFLLMLKGWARKLILIMCCVSVVITVLDFTVYLKSKDALDDMAARTVETVFQKKRQEIVEKYNAEEQKKFLEVYSKVMKMIPNIIHTLYYSAIIFLLLWYALIIFFFTRPKVKRQFIGAES